MVSVSAHGRSRYRVPSAYDAAVKVREVIRYVVILEQSDGGFGAYVPDLPGCIAVGETREEALRLIREAVELHLEGMREEGLPVPEPSSSSEYVEVGAA